MPLSRWPGSTSIYDFLKRANAASLRRNWRIDGDHLERLWQFKGGILALNHGHFVDGTVVMPLVRERVLFMCDARAVDAPVLGHVLRAMGILRVGVTRPAAAAALAAHRAASQGHVLGIFPEGRVSRASGLLPGRPGAVHLASKLGLPILPVAMWGLEAFDRPLDVYVRRARPAIHIRVGFPQVIAIPPGSSSARAAAADAIMVLIATSLPPSMRGVYAAGTPRYVRGCQALDAGWVHPGETAARGQHTPAAGIFG